MLTAESEILQSKWVKQEKIGSDSVYGIVYRGYNKNTSQLIAIKKIKTVMGDYGIPVELLRETVILNSLEHPNIVKIYDVIYTDDKLYLIFEYMNSDLKKFMDSFPQEEQIPMPLIKEILRQILSGLAYLNYVGILHRDIKLQNILINYEKEKGEVIVKVADFGLARTYSVFSKRLSKGVVTPLYRAPEIFLDANEYTNSIDIWSVGCIFAEMVNKTPLFIAKTETDVIINIFKLLGIPEKNIMSNEIRIDKSQSKTWQEICPSLDAAGLDLLSKMLVIDPEKRITPTQALEHEFFQS